MNTASKQINACPSALSVPFHLKIGVFDLFFPFFIFIFIPSKGCITKILGTIIKSRKN